MVHRLVKKLFEHEDEMERKLSKLVDEREKKSASIKSEIDHRIEVIDAESERLASERLELSEVSK